MHTLTLRRSLLLAGLTLALGGCVTAPPRPPAPTTDEIVQMSKDGIPPAEIIQRLEESRALYPLKASQLAKLREEGVSDEVIDYMQQTLIETERMREAMRERDRMWMYGYPYYPAYPWGYWRRPYR
ncbi:MAG: hypothetical protein NVV69_00380 [Methyloversatilis sp.]|jgi:hypothetical protein|uniref:hypothetical protein n=1 Tax=Methyloversatilis TaxID=378210 RepID=UPI000371F461|nr:MULTISPECIES: hypothetical protein [Methyloversatilis]MCR6664484.1 hypothetical protein [Methyloversatilis sp.]PZU55286.1 MAG: hypothetical protein DI561_02670 [Thauera sp.]